MKSRLLLACVVAVVSTGCANKPWNPDEYPVSSGDTIFSIAWRYELDPYELARWNGLASPYRIYPGQRLKMRPDDPRVSARSASARSRHGRAARPDTVTVGKGDTLYAIAQEYGMTIRELAAINDLQSPYTIKPGQTLRLSASKPGRSRASVADRNTATTAKAASTKAATAANGRITWQWPVEGKLIRTFKSDAPDRKGIDIAGKPGRTIRAAAPGKVVYSGNGLISYGNLVIIKHNRTYLSAYAHNRRVLVKEGEFIEAGQKIAELGQTGAESPRLHFEIRKNGKPVNPMKYLPRS